MGKKLLVSLAMEGKFSSEGLQAINEEDDILMAMARELVTEKGIGERADAVWSALQKRQDEAFVKPFEPGEPIPEPVQDSVLLLSDSAVPADDRWLPLSTPWNQFVERPRDVRARSKVNSPCSDSAHSSLGVNPSVFSRTQTSSQKEDVQWAFSD
jgi:hypothetical protein